MGRRWFVRGYRAIGGSDGQLLAGVLFLFIAVVGKISGKIEPELKARCFQVFSDPALSS
jgi:hypothetical protein